MDRSRPIPVAGSSNIQNGKSVNQQKCEQVMFECVQKVAEIIVQSRLDVPRSQIEKRGRVRFNLEIDEVDFVRQSMQPWGADPHLPLYIDIFLQQGGQSIPTQSLNAHHILSADQITPLPTRILLERWYITYSPLSSRHTTGDTLVQLRHMCKRIIILLRTLYAYVRIMPVHQLHRHLRGSQKGVQPGGDDIGFCMGAREGGSGLDFLPVSPTKEYQFVPLKTPYGAFSLVTRYCKKLDGFLNLKRSSILSADMLRSDTIIMDYVPQQMSGLGAQLQEHNMRQQKENLSGQHLKGQISNPLDMQDLSRNLEGIREERMLPNKPLFNRQGGAVDIPRNQGEVVGDIGYSRSLDTKGQRHMLYSHMTQNQSMNQFSKISAPYGYGPSVPSEPSPLGYHEKAYSGGFMSPSPPIYATNSDVRAKLCTVSLPASPDMCMNRRHTVQGCMPLVREGVLEASTEGSSGVNDGLFGAETPSTHGTPPFCFRKRNENMVRSPLEQPIVSFSPPFTVAPISQFGSNSEGGIMTHSALVLASHQLESLPESPFRTSIHPTRTRSSIHFPYSMDSGSIFIPGGNKLSPLFTSSSNVLQTEGADQRPLLEARLSSTSTLKIPPSSSILASANLHDGGSALPFAISTEELTVKNIYENQSVSVHTANEDENCKEKEHDQDNCNSKEHKKKPVQTLEEELEAFRSFAKDLLGPT